MSATDGSLNLDSTINPPIGGKKRGRPAKDLSLVNIAKLHHIPLRSLERAVFIRRHGVPELVKLVEDGELKLSLAEFVSRWPPDFQRDECRLGAAHIRSLALFVRKALEQEQADER